MNSRCPKCSAITEVDQSLVPEKGMQTKCTECKTIFWVYRESFGARALRKGGQIHCIQCGSGLGPTLSCPSCGILYPDFAVSQSAKPTPKRKARIPRSFTVSYRPSRKPRPQPHHKQVAVPQKQAGRKSRVKGYAIAIAALAVAAAIGTGIYLRHQTELMYAKNYVRALYGIKVGVDSGLDSYKKRLTTPLISKDDAKNNNVKIEVDKLMQKVSSPPKKYVDANDKLSKLYRIYSEIHSITSKPSDSLKNYADAADKLESDFEKGMKELESSIPRELSEELENARVKYKALRKT